MKFTNNDYSTSIVALYMNKFIGRNIIDARMRKNFTQEYVAKKLGISTLTYGNIEGAKNETIKMEQLQQIATVLETEIDELLKGKEGITVTAPITQSVVNGSGNTIGISETLVIGLTNSIDRLCTVLEKWDKK